MLRVDFLKGEGCLGSGELRDWFEGRLAEVKEMEFHNKERLALRVPRWDGN